MSSSSRSKKRSSCDEDIDIDTPAQAQKKAKMDTHTDEGVSISIPTRIGRKETIYTLKQSQPVLQLSIPSTVEHSLTLHPDSSSNNNADFLSQLLFPLPLNSFFDFCFRKHAVHIQSNQLNRTESIADTFLFSLNTEQILQHSSSENIFLWLHSPLNSQKKPMQSVEIADPQTAFLLHQAGSHAVYCRAPPELEQTLVPCLLQGTGLGCGQYDPTGEKTISLGRGEVEVFIGTQNHITGWHTDFQENFTLQLSGKKRWTFKQGTVQYPLRGITPHYHSPDTVESQIKSAKLSNSDFNFGWPIDTTESSSSSSRALGDEMQIDMNPGDVLYFPAGMWHTVETLEPGISINVSLMAMNYASLVCKSLEHFLLGKKEWRETVWNRPMTQGPSPIVTHVDALLDDLTTVVAQFKQKGGAACIVPPSLRYHHHPTSAHTEEDHHETSSNSSNHSMALNSHHEEEDEEDDEEEDESNRSKDDEVIISVSNFSGPSEWSLEAPSSKHILVRNPLASLISLKDIQSFYTSDNGSDNEEPVFVLNVNFAGNDSHESMIRVLLKDDTVEQSLAICYEWESKDLPIAPSFIPPPALIYYGYLVWSLAS